MILNVCYRHDLVLGGRISLTTYKITSHGEKVDTRRTTDYKNVITLRRNLFLHFLAENVKTGKTFRSSPWGSVLLKKCLDQHLIYFSVLALKRGKLFLISYVSQLKSILSHFDGLLLRKHEFSFRYIYKFIYFSGYLYFWGYLRY